MARRDDIEKLVAASDWRDEGNSLEDILPLAEVIVFIYNSKRGHGIRVEDPTRVRALIDLMTDLLETLKNQVEEEFGEYVMVGVDDSRESYSSDTSDAGSVAWSEYTVKSIASWKERTSWFFRFRFTGGVKRSMTC
ncbi:hypothetical protein EI94DRAFT_1795955 [Lactarius quietus]|nr:hypothetical protein EI94DRAFT_1795955 [Lactarius quietus]